MMHNFNEIFVDDTKNVERVSSKEYLANGKIAIIDQGKDLIIGYTNDENYKICKEERIIFGDHTRIFKYINIPFITGADGTKVLKLIDTNKYNYKYFYYYLLHCYIPNTGYNRHFKWVKELKFNIPKIGKQIEIANKLDKLQEVINLRKKQIDELDELIKSQFSEMFGDPIENPKNNKIVKLSDIAEYWNGLTYKPTDVNKEGTIVLRSSNIQNSRLDYEDVVRVDCDIKEKLYVKDNDILMCSRNGSSRLVGKVAVIKDTLERMTFGAFMMIIRSEYYPYLFSYFQTDAFRNQIKSGATTTINQITGNMLNKIKLPLPDMKDIEKFTEFVKQVDKQKFLIEKSLKETKDLQESLMNKYFL